MKVKRVLTVSAAVCVLLLGRAAAQSHKHPVAVEKIPLAITPVGPAVLENTSRAPGTFEATITAAPTQVSLIPGVTTPVYAYNGRVPGPLIELREGDRVTIHFKNELPEPTTIHWHGLHIPAASDGSPFNLVEPGGTYDYVFTIQPGAAGTYWYHPHPDLITGRQIARGLAGALIIRPERDPLPPLTEKLFVLWDNKLATDGSVAWPDPTSLEAIVNEVNGREGPLLFVNGVVSPTVTIRSGEIQRWRIINASAARVYRLAIPGQTLIHVGNDGGLFEVPREVPELIVANSERVEILVRGTGPPGSRAVLQTLPYDRYVPQTRPQDWNTPLDLVKIEYTTEPPTTSPAIPARLRPVPAIPASSATATRIIAFSQGLINGKAMDMSRVDITARLGATEIWQIENVVGMDHPFHLHGFQFQVLERNGVPEPYRSWKDSVNVPKHETVKIVVRYDDYPGKWMFHCHILDHEDMGMMGVLEVVR